MDFLSYYHQAVLVLWLNAVTQKNMFISPSSKIRGSLNFQCETDEARGVDDFYPMIP